MDTEVRDQNLAKLNQETKPGKTKSENKSGPEIK